MMIMIMIVVVAMIMIMMMGIIKCRRTLAGHQVTPADEPCRAQLAKAFVDYHNDFLGCEALIYIYTYICIYVYIYLCICIDICIVYTYIQR